ncbi:MAG: transcription elongation factor GreA [Actinobacteria bacterium]|uniref:Transcription elongation factor GreA n=1 Tax=freshwater metagenome TaxID=449393 RepID=A0A6J5ZRB4_9ZZZZ|nr:transcription elongation factor GreA [Actinomycetota bacterium]
MNETWLTQDGYDRLKAELDNLSGPFREEIKQRIATAREEGDLKENGGYHAAREEQGKNEARIRQLAKMLESATIGTPDFADGKVAQGMVITVHFPDLDDTETFLLGSREQNAHTAIDVYSPTSALGAAVLGQEVGAQTSYTAPSGKIIRIEIVKAEPYVG